MADSVKTTEQIWVFGRKQAFKIYDCGEALDTRQYQQEGGHPARRQKNQIVLHFTLGNGSARSTVRWWNMIAPLDSHLYYCQRYFLGHAYSSPTPGNCPTPGHGELKKIPNRASAHFVVERASERLSASQPYTDVIQVVDSDTITWHGEAVNDNSIGIEHSNAGPDWNVSNDDTFTGTGAAKRPTDENHWLHLDSPSRPNSNLVHNDFQAYEEEQYLAMILLLRSLCIKHRIPRRFLGDTTDEKMARWWNGRDALTRSRLMRFRGILSHMNCHATKECGGPALHRNRLFRGIIDEWWLPVELEGKERPYYMGPFDPRPNRPSHYTWDGGALAPVTFHDADLDLLQETRSYYDLNRTDFYGAKTETLAYGGTYPIGTNKIWHGGVHFGPNRANLKVYAAASGTIVAARLGSDADVEADTAYGSQRFVLIRHAVYWRTEADPGGGERLDYTSDPTYFFTLYMHLAPFADPGDVDDYNPPWFNYWLRHLPADDATDPMAVFCPNVPVSVGDWIGACGKYRGKDMIHFEVMSNFEMTVAPWNDPAKRIYDDDSNIICDSAAINSFVQSVVGQGITQLDVLRAARALRNAKSYHKSVWSLSSADSLKPVLPDEASRKRAWKSIEKFTWVADAVAACPDLSSQLCDATGMVWHYHPVTFMDFVNNLVLRENAQADEPDYHDTNVVMDGEFLTRFVDFASGSAVSAAADNQVVKPFAISVGAYGYHFTRKELACVLAAPHNPAQLTATRFHIGLLDVLEDIRESYGNSITVALSHVCAGHKVPANAAACVLGYAGALDTHAAGMAVDIRPSGATRAKCKSLLEAADEAAAQFTASCGEHSGEPSRGDFQGHAQTVYVMCYMRDKIENNTATNAEISAFGIHLEISESAPKAYWVAWIRSGTMASSVSVSSSGGSSGDITGIYPSKMFGDSEKAKDAPNTVSVGPGQWQSIIKRGSRAKIVALRSPGIVGFYENAADAAAEGTMGDPWIEER